MKRLWHTARKIGWFNLAFLGFLALPGLAQLALRDKGVTTENRVLAPVPAMPADLAAALHWPKQVDAWLDDHFGLRGSLVMLNNWVRWHGFGELATTRLIKGGHGRLFMGSHDGGIANSLILDVCGKTSEPLPDIAASVTHLLDRTSAAGLRPTLMIVPTAARLYPEDIPEPLATACRGATPAVDTLVAQLGRQDVFYPVAEMLALKPRMDVIPRRHFHWVGEPPLRVAERLAGQHWGLPRVFPLALEREYRSSDLAEINPGLGLVDTVKAPQYRNAGVHDCEGPHGLALCGPIPGIPDAAASVIARYERPGEGRLLVVADSFGDEIGHDFTEYFAEVWMVHLNTIGSLSPADHAIMAKALLQRFVGDRVVFVVHDAGALGGMSPFEHVLFPQ